jgi:uncharacterized membrane protein
MSLAVDPYIWDWGDLLFRWLHVIAAIVWIGTSFYFVALDNHLRPPADPRDAERGIGGESWEIHGGGFYRIEKFKVAPPDLPEPLHWFKWEAYTTWLSGFALFVVVYYVHASSYLVDPQVADLETWAAILISIGGLALAWVVYDALCRLLGRDERLVAAAVFGFVALSAWGASELFSGRAAYLEVGAMIGTMMVGNVFFVIIPAHWELVRAKQAGREPDPRWNVRGKQRSVHNNYLTLPVLVPFAKANAVIQERCVPCHSAHPTEPGFSTAPKGVRLDTRAEIEAQAKAIEQQAVDLKIMPPGNLTHMTKRERDLLARWLRSR